MEIRLISEQNNDVLKFKKKDFYSPVLEIIFDDPSVNPEEIIVEVWAAFNDRMNQIKTGFGLKYSFSDGCGHFYKADIELKETGHFEVRYCIKYKGEVIWAKERTEVWVDPDWINNSIVYNAFIRFFGAKRISKDGTIKPGEGGTFADVKRELKKLKGMGINVLYLNPVHPIGELYRNYNPDDLLPAYLQPGCPYSIKDYKAIDSELSFSEHRLGEEQHPFSEFKKLVDYAHELGIRVIMDMVFNHSAHDSVFQRIHPEWYLYKKDINSLEAPYIYPEEITLGEPWGDAKHTFAPNDHGYWWHDAAQLNWNNIDDYPEFIMKPLAPNKAPKNPTIDEMYAYFKNITKFWVREFGIDGFRCDVAYRVPLDFWKECIVETRKVAKECYPENKSIDGDVVFIAENYYVNLNEHFKAGFTMCYGDFSNKLGTLPEIKGYLDYMYSNEHFVKNPWWFIFPECHDFHRTPEKVAAHLREEHKDADLNANMSRWTITACLPGTPMIFNGFEKIEWNPVNLFSYNSIDWESDKDITEHITKVNHIRNNEIALQKGKYIFLETNEGVTDSAKIFSFARVYKDEVIIVAINLDVVNNFGTEISLCEELPINFDDFVITDLMTGKEYSRMGKALTVILLPGQAHIFKVKK